MSVYRSEPLSDVLFGAAVCITTDGSLDSL